MATRLSNRGGKQPPLAKYEIHYQVEEKRACGYRYAGERGVGVYLMGAGRWEMCERLPYPVPPEVKFVRGPQWLMRPKDFFDGDPHCAHAQNRRELGVDYPATHQHWRCRLCNPPDDPALLLWVGRQYYTPKSFTNEALLRGVSKRIAGVPELLDFTGKTVCYLAHLDACGEQERATGETPLNHPGVFLAFLPTHIDLVIDDPDSIPEYAKRLKDRLGENARLVKVYGA